MHAYTCVCTCIQTRRHRGRAAGCITSSLTYTDSRHAGTVHGAIVAGQQAASQLQAAMRGYDPADAGERFVEEYLARLSRTNYGDDGDDGEQGDEVWDRNP